MSSQTLAAGMSATPSSHISLASIAEFRGKPYRAIPPLGNQATAVSKIEVPADTTFFEASSAHNPSPAAGSYWEAATRSCSHQGSGSLWIGFVDGFEGPVRPYQGVLRRLPGTHRGWDCATDRLVRKPYDNYYTLISIDADPEGEVLSLDLGYGWCLSFPPASAELSENQRKLTIRVESGEMLTDTVRQRFGSGEVVFCVEDGESSRAALTANGKLLQPFIR